MGKASGPIGELCGMIQTGWKAVTADGGHQREREKASQPAVVPSRKFPGENGHHPVTEKLDKEPKDFTGLGDLTIAFNALQPLLTADSSDRLSLTYILDT